MIPVALAWRLTALGSMAKGAALSLFGWIKSWPWQVWAVIAVAIGLWYSHHRGVEAGRAEVRVAWEAAKADQARKDKAAAEHAQQQRQQRAARGRAILATLKKENADALDARDRVLAGIRDGSFKLRDRFRCPAAAAAPGAGARGSDEAAAGGLSDADAEFLVGFAADADAVVRQLAACQATLSADRAQLAMPAKLRAMKVADSP